MGNSSKRDTQKIDSAERRRRAIELRKAGLSYEEIGKQLGVDRPGAYRIVQAGILTIVKEPAEEMRTIELARLDAMLVGLWPKARSGDTHAVDCALRVMMRRARYLGLDAPVAVRHSGHVSFDPRKLSDEELERIARGVDADAAAAGDGGVGATEAEAAGDRTDDAGGGDR